MALYRISDLNVEIKTNSPSLAESIPRYEVDYQAAPNITLEMSDAAKALVADVGYDPDFGARPLKRAVISQLETPLAREIISGKIPPESTVRVEVKDGALDFQVK